MCYGFVPVENPTSFVLKSPQKILHKIRPKESAYLQPYKLNGSNSVSHTKGSFLLLVYEKSKRKVRTYSKHKRYLSTTLLPAKESRPYIFLKSPICPRHHLFTNKKISRHLSFSILK